jgi:hypothetical protein
MRLCWVREDVAEAASVGGLARAVIVTAERNFRRLLYFSAPPSHATDINVDQNLTDQAFALAAGPDPSSGRMP